MTVDVSVSAMTKLDAYLGEIPLKMSATAVTKLMWLIYVGLSFNGCINTYDNKLPNLKITVCASEISNVGNCYDPCDLENKIRVKYDK